MPTAPIMQVPIGTKEAPMPPLQLRSFRLPFWLLETIEEGLDSLRPLVRTRSSVVRMAIVFGLREIRRRLNQEKPERLLRDYYEVEETAEAVPKHGPRANKLLSHRVSPSAGSVVWAWYSLPL